MAGAQIVAALLKAGGRLSAAGVFLAQRLAAHDSRPARRVHGGGNKPRSAVLAAFARRLWAALVARLQACGGAWLYAVVFFAAGLVALLLPAGAEKFLDELVADDREGWR